jgi:hypothetical protein
MTKLNLPEYKFNIKKNSRGKFDIFDLSRKKYVALTPEEWVRQNFIRFLIEEKNYPSSLIAVEKKIIVNKLTKRFDAVVYDNNGSPAMLLEFKAPDILITQKVFEQISIYNQILKVKYLIVSNGLKHYCCKVLFETKTITFLKDIPNFELVNG